MEETKNKILTADKTVLPYFNTERRNYVVKNLNILESKEKEEIISKIKEQFDQPENFFKIDEKIIIGKKLLFQTEENLINKTNRNHNIRTNSIKIFNNPPQSANLNGNNITHNRTTRFVTNILKDKNKLPACLTEEQSERKVDLLSTNQVNEIFTAAKRRCSTSKDKLNDFYFQNDMIKSKDKINFLQQGRILQHADRINLRSANISKKISSQINKEEDDLLMNRIVNYRIRKQMKEILEDQRSFPQQYGDKAWMLDLRREKNSKRIRYNYVNIASDHKPIWEQLIEYPKKKIEFIHSPREKTSKDLQYFYKNKHLRDACCKANFDIEKMNQHNQIVVNGRNLLDEEFRKVSECVGNKKITRKSYKEYEMRDEIIKEDYTVDKKKQNYTRCLLKTKK